MRAIALLLLLMTTAAAQAMLSVNCDVQADKYGFVELQAFAGYYIGEDFYCYNTNVTATISETTYEMEQLYTCEYTRMMQLPPGQYDVTYNAYFPDHESLDSFCQFNVTVEDTMNVIVYGLKEGDVFTKGTELRMEAVAVLESMNVNAGITAQLMQGTTVLQEKTLIKDILGAQIGTFLLNLSDGNYRIMLTAAYSEFVAQREFNITVTSSSVQNVSVSGLSMIIIEPEAIVYPENSLLELQAELQDNSNKIVSGAVIKADIYRDGVKLDTVELSPASWYYRGSYLFESKGEYRIDYTATKGYSTTQSSVSFFVGNETEQSKTVNFSVSIISPTSSVYIRDSVINVRAKLMLDTEPVANASVVLILDNEQITMAYDKFGEYKATIGPLEEGAYDLKAVATKDNLVSQDKISFMISRHIINIDTISPYYNQEFEFSKGEALKVKAIVLDEGGDIVSGALVVAKTMDPDGKVLQMQLFQDKVTGEYSANLYLNDATGNYKVSIEASKAGYVPAVKDSQFYIEFKQEQFQFFSGYMTVENLLTIVLVIAILILLAALLRAVF